MHTKKENPAGAGWAYQTNFGSDYDRISAALQAIDPSDRDTWTRMGMALKSELGDTGFDLWDAWSQQAASYVARDAKDVWRSIRAGGKVTIATLFHEAKLSGWCDDGMHQKPTPEELAERKRASLPASKGAVMDTKSIYRAGTIKRTRRTNAQIELLDQQIIDVLKEDHPQSVRHVFYRMTDPRLPEPVEKSDAGYRHVQDRCVKLRRSGRIPYSWIADMSRRGYFVTTFAGAGDFISRMAGLYRADLWELSNYRCEVWCESRSIASVLQADCEELAVDLFPCGGFSSLSFVHEAAEQQNGTGDTRPLVVFYIGDYDPAGVLIDVALERELRLHLNSDIDMTFVRIGINEEQIAEYDLPTKPRKGTDTRSQQVASTVEAEAMPASILRGLLREEIEALLPEGALAAAKVAERSEREGLRLLAARVRP